MSRPLRQTTLLAMALGLLGCATPLTHEDVEGRLRSAGASVRGVGGDLLITAIHADSRAAAWTLMAEARTEGASLGARRLSHDLRRGAKLRRAVVVGGPYDDLTRLVLLDALELLEGRSLDGLTLVYVGDGKHARELRTLAREHRARFYHRNFR